jgi:hypothetical protein
MTLFLFTEMITRLTAIVKGSDTHRSHPTEKGPTTKIQLPLRKGWTRKNVDASNEVWIGRKRGLGDDGGEVTKDGKRRRG